MNHPFLKCLERPPLKIWHFYCKWLAIKIIFWRPENFLGERENISNTALQKYVLRRGERKKIKFAQRTKICVTTLGPKIHYVCFKTPKKGYFCHFEAHIINFWAKNSKIQKCNFRELLGPFCTITWPSFRFLIIWCLTSIQKREIPDIAIKSLGPILGKNYPFLLIIFPKFG